MGKDFYRLLMTSHFRYTCSQILNWGEKLMIFLCIPKLNSCKVVCFFGKIEIGLMYECQTLCFVVIGRGLSITLTASDNKQNHMLITSWYLMISEWGHTKNFLCLLMCVSDFFLTLNSLFHENLVLWYFLWLVCTASMSFY